MWLAKYMKYRPRGRSTQLGTRMTVGPLTFPPRVDDESTVTSGFVDRRLTKTSGVDCSTTKALEVGVPIASVSRAAPRTRNRTISSAAIERSSTG